MKNVRNSGNVTHGRETMLVDLEDGRTIEVSFQFFGGGVLDRLTWDGFQAVNEEDLTNWQVHEGGIFKNSETPKVGDIWASLYCGQAGSVYFPVSSVRAGKEGEINNMKIVWIGKYPNSFGYDKNIVIMEMLN